MSGIASDTADESRETVRDAASATVLIPHHRTSVCPVMSRGSPIHPQGTVSATAEVASAEVITGGVQIVLRASVHCTAVDKPGRDLTIGKEVTQARRKDRVGTARPVCGPLRDGGRCRVPGFR